MSDAREAVGWPTNKRQARAWVRAHWQDYMRNADVPDLRDTPDSAVDLIGDVWSDEGRRLANRLEPKP